MFPHIHLGPLSLDAYFTLMALALAIPLFHVPGRARRMLPEREKEFGNLVLALYAAALVGFRLFHVVFELPGYYLAHPLEIFQVWKGGFVAYGGLITPIAVMALWIRARKLPGLVTADIFAAPICLIFVVARMACFARGCCYGEPGSGPLCVAFPPGSVAYGFMGPVPLVATQLWLSGAALATFGAILLFETRLKRLHFPGLSAALFLLLYPTARFVVEFWRADFRGGTLAGLSVGQWMSLALLGLGAVLFLWGRRARTRA